MNLTDRTMAIVRYTTCLIVVFFIGIAGQVAWADQARIRARIGIELQSGESTSIARSRNRARAGDRLRIHVRALDTAYIYVVHSDGATATLLEQAGPGAATTGIALPSVNEYFEFDGNSAIELITVVCASAPLEQFDLFRATGDAEHARWAAIETDLKYRGRIRLGGAPEKPLAIAGNVRGGELGGSRYPVYSGRRIIVKRFEFKIKK